jgi:hypothetical protein
MLDLIPIRARGSEEYGRSREELDAFQVNAALSRLELHDAELTSFDCRVGMTGQETDDDVMDDQK